MRTNVVVISAACAAAVVGWWARGIEWTPIDPAPAAVVQHAALREESHAATPSIDSQRIAARVSLGSRNLFAYREVSLPPSHLAFSAPPPVVVREVAPPPAVAVIDETPRLRFTSRYIGRFGTNRNQIAAFAKDGQIVTVRVGDRIDEHFVLRRIGIESVEVEARDGGEVITQQVPLG
jgi:hypothetical protein